MADTENSESDGLPSWVVIAAVALGAVLLGFAAGWILRGGGGDATVLAPATAAEQATPEEADSDTPTEETSDPPEQPAAAAQPRSETDVAVLNGSGQAGLASQTASQLLDAGYKSTFADNGPATPGPSSVYFIAGRRAEASRLRSDLQLSAPVQALPDGPVRDLAPEGSELVVVLGSG